MSSASASRTDSIDILGETVAGLGRSTTAAVPKQFVRIDAGHSDQPPKGETNPQPLTDPADDSIQPRKTAQASQSASMLDRESLDEARLDRREQSWLQLHAIELIERLQTWCEDLDRREAQLNSRTALLEHRERQLRLRQQSNQLELSEMKLRFDKEASDIRAVARRIAFES